MFGDYSFGKPAKITVNTFTGKSGIINIEREVELSGSTHSKGVLILSRIYRRIICTRYTSFTFCKYMFWTVI